MLEKEAGDDAGKNKIQSINGIIDAIKMKIQSVNFCASSWLAYSSSGAGNIDSTEF
jgi:hypothetical protein